MKRIGIFGGTFNPVHIEHVRTANAVIKELCLDALFIVPTNIPPHKNVIPASGEHRLKTLELAFKDQPKVIVSDAELNVSGKSYSYITAENFRKKYADAEIFLIIGRDMLLDFKTWKNPERILAAVDLAVVGREGYYCDEGAEREYFIRRFGKEFISLDFVGREVSSTYIRTYLAFGLRPEGIDKDVFEYIVKNGVYPPDKYQKFILENLTEKRIVHTANVVVTALKKARELDLDEEKIRIACTLHDCAKYLNPNDFKDFTLPAGVPRPVVHAFLGAFVAEKTLGVTDGEILDAIRYHTSGKPKMSDLAKLVFTADMIEPDRTYEGVEILREKYERDFNDCFLTCLKEEVIHLKNRGGEIYSETLNAFDYYIKE